MIEGKKIILQSLSEDDLPYLIDIHNNAEIKKMAMFHPFPVTAANDQIWLKAISNDTSNKSVYFSIREKKANSFAGYVSLQGINWINRNCYFGIVVASKFQAQGIGSEVTALVLDYAVNKLNLIKVQLEVIADNNIAIDLYKKLGFEIEGILKKHFFYDGNYYDVHLMAYFHNHKL